MEERKKILLISDNVVGNGKFIGRLKEKYDVCDVGYITTAEYKLRKAYDYWLVIIEVSLKPLKEYSLKETENGQKTGIVFYERELRNLDLPVIFWSWSDEYCDEISKLGPNVIFVKKEMEEDHLLKAALEFIGE